MLCPHCSEELRISDRNGIEIDYCPKCRGVWLDRGELDKIIERSDDFRSEQEMKQYEARPNRKRSRFGDLFDFD